MKLKFIENIGSRIIKFRVKYVVRKIPVIKTRQLIIKIIPTDLILGKNEYTIKNNPTTRTLIEIDISRGNAIKSK